MVKLSSHTYNSGHIIYYKNMIYYVKFMYMYFPFLLKKKLEMTSVKVKYKLKTCNLGIINPQGIVQRMISLIYPF